MAQGISNSGGGSSFKAEKAGECIQRDRSQDTNYLRANGQIVSESSYPDIKGMFYKTGLGTLRHNSKMNDMWIEENGTYRFNGDLFTHGYDPNEGYFIYKSIDNGMNWSKVSGEGEGFTKVGKIEQIGNLLIGTDGYNIKTSNDGITWITKATLDSFVLKASFAYNNNTIVVVPTEVIRNTFCNAFISSNGGITFEEIDETFYTRTFGIAYGKGMFITSGYQDGNTILSSNDGVTWIDRGKNSVANTGKYLDFDNNTQTFYWLSPYYDRAYEYVHLFTSSTGWNYKMQEIAKYSNTQAYPYYTHLIRYLNQYMIVIQFVDYGSPTSCRIYTSQSLTGTYADISASIGLSNIYAVLTEDNFYMYGDNEVFMIGTFEKIDESAGWDIGYNLITSQFNVSLPNYSSVCYIRVKN